MSAPTTVSDWKKAEAEKAIELSRARIVQRAAQSDYERSVRNNGAENSKQEQLRLGIADSNLAKAQSEYDNAKLSVTKAESAPIGTSNIPAPGNDVIDYSSGSPESGSITLAPLPELSSTVRPTPAASAQQTGAPASPIRPTPAASAQQAGAPASPIRPTSAASAQQAGAPASTPAPTPAPVAQQTGTPSSSEVTIPSPSEQQVGAPDAPDMTVSAPVAQQAGESASAATSIPAPVAQQAGAPASTTASIPAPVAQQAGDTDSTPEFIPAPVAQQAGESTSTSASIPAPVVTAQAVITEQEQRRQQPPTVERFGPENPPAIDQNSATGTGTTTTITRSTGAPGSSSDVESNSNPTTATGTANARRSSSDNQVVEFANRYQKQDFRLRIHLADNSNYLYNKSEALYPEEPAAPYLLEPLVKTKGVIFPYTPTITMGYSANYDAQAVTHSNYRLIHYQNSSVDNITINGVFTAQDTNEAQYLLAVIHFFRTVTKMFYGQDLNPARGTPPPLCYITGHGQYMFNNHPVVINSFNLTYPDDVDYINAGEFPLDEQARSSYNPPTSRSQPFRMASLKKSGLNPGGTKVRYNSIQTSTSAGITRVPSKLQISITAIPVVTRNVISNNFSLEKYASGLLMAPPTASGTKGVW